MNEKRKNVPIAGIILAGGLASRIGGGDKTLLKLDKYTILEHVLKKLSKQVEEVVLNANGDTTRFSKYRVPVITDITEGNQGPLAGVLAGLEWADRKGFAEIVTVAADTPFFPCTLVKDLISAKEKTNSVIALACSVEPKTKRIIKHPTFGVWPTELKDDLRISLGLGVRKVVKWTEKFKQVDVPFKKDQFDPFFNVNTPADLRTARFKVREKLK